ncbi:MAG: alkaline phosphatase [Nocardioides sp.]|nr:alkaline phosphatase [Nocardioides sp.]
MLPDPAEAAGKRYFRHGVASGDPRPTKCVIWTRVTPTAQATPGSGKGPKVTVRWEVAKDARFRKVVRRGTFSTGPHRDHTVKLDVTGLKSGRRYFYRFVYRGTRSRVGRLQTAPARSASPRNLRFGVVSCANLQAVWFSVYRHLAKRHDLDAVVHLGDYLYEYGPGEYGYGSDNVDIRRHDPAHEMVSLEDYRRRHAQYKRDPDLQDAHARFPWIVTWDDHEVTNDQWRGGAENHDASEGDYLKRRARAHRAYDEWMPVLLDGTAELGDGTRLFRRLRFGKLAEISMLDLRTYRSEQVATPAIDPAVSNPHRTITGKVQLRWLKKSFVRKRALWKVIGNPVMITPVTFAQLPGELVDPVSSVTGIIPTDGAPYNVDQWDGYTHDRQEVVNFINNHHVENALFITGDIHSAWACEIPNDVGSYPLSGSAGVEFVCSSVTSNNLKDITGTPSRTTSIAVEQVIMADNPHIKHLNFDDHGFSVLDLNAKRAQMDWFVISDRADRDATLRYQTSYVTRTGTSTVQRADGPVAR